MSEKKFDPVEHGREMREKGYWLDLTFDDLLTDAVRKFPDKNAVVAYRADAGSEKPVRTITFKELEGLVAKAAGALRGLGVRKGDVVALMLPNWWEFVVATYAAARIGAVCNPLMHIFRERELRFMLGFADTKVIIIPKEFRGFDFAKMMDGLRGELPALKHVIVAGGEGDTSFDKTLLQSDAAPVGPNPPERMACDEMCSLMYTSGTTGEPKGVMHCFNTIVACTDALGERFHLTSDDVHHGSTPFGHMTGFTAVMVQALRYGSTVVLQDIWEPNAGVAIMAREGVSHMAAATPFLADIVKAVEAGGPKPKLKTFLCGGAPIPPVIVEKAISVLDLNVSSLWGMTETLGGSLTEPERAREKSSTTDGRALNGMKLLITDDDYKPLPLGETGRFLVTGSSLFLGYYKRPDLANIQPGGWFDTGDMAYMDEEGYIRINGRTKDIIIRGGENVPVVEIEDLLYRHPSVADAAMVGYPDDRLGERGCAFVVLQPGASFDLSEMQAYLSKAGAAKQYWPEQIEIINAMPRTASGKIQKFVLREQAKKYAS
ncbi:MAG: AMP-binding protein [Flavobacteriaceae bacterium]